MKLELQDVMNEFTDTVRNESGNPHLLDLASPSRRGFLATATGVASLSFLGAPTLTACATVAGASAAPGFVAVPVSTADTVTVPAGYRADVIYAWGDPIDSIAPKFRFDAGNSAADQALQAGMHHDGMSFFPLPRGASTSNRGLLCVNHEYTDQGLLFTDGTENWSAAKVAKSVNAHGVSVVEVAVDGGKWSVVASRYARRITGATPMRVSGPAAGHRLMQTSADPEGRTVLGTLNNCANGRTPWGTYLTCEENFNGYFAYTVAKSPQQVIPPDLRRYGVGLPNFDENGNLRRYGFGYDWHRFETRFDVAQAPNEPNRFGWVVEIDPFDRASMPVKRTALGRCKHESAEVVLTSDQRVVVYMGDDERNEYIYKFVSAGRFDPADPYRASHRDLLDTGTLYVARFDANGTGLWLPLVHGQGGLTAANGFNDQAEVLIRTRQAADRLGATMMDRPEWIASHPVTKQVYVTLTNNARRSAAQADPAPTANRADGSTAAASARPVVDAANPRPDNVFGHIVRWNEDGGDPAALGFRWEIFMLAGNPKHADPAKHGNIRGDVFGSPDGIWFDSSGLLWIQTDVSTATINSGSYAGMGNNQMLACDASTRDVRRFLVGPVGCEVTGVAMTPDRRAMFVNIQHPGENAAEGPTDPANPRRFSNWPDQRPDGRPRSATLAITRSDGGVVGS